MEDGSNITIKDSIIGKNDARHGGVIFSQDNSWILIHGTTLRSNRANRFGGVIHALHNSSVLVNDSTFDSNNAGNNGGVFDCFNATSIRMYGSKFMHNFARLKGGVLVITNANSKDSQVSTTNEVKDCTFSNNSAPYGGVFALQRKVNMTIQRSNFNSNTTKTDGGILHALIWCSITIYNSSFNDTMAVNNGVLLASYNCNITIYGSQFNNNTAGFKLMEE